MQSNQERDIRNRADVVDTDRDRVRTTIEDPQGSAKAQGESMAVGEATARGGSTGVDAQAQASGVRKAALNPEFAAEERGESELEAQKREAQVSVGITAGSESDKPKDK
jgi:hypothetical protein